MTTGRPQRPKRGDAQEIERRAQELAGLTSEQISKGSGENFWSGLAQGGLNVLKSAIDVVDTPRAVVTSTVQEGGDIFDSDDFSLSEYAEQIFDPSQRVDFRDWLNPDSKASKGVQGALIGFAGDVLLDPLTYVGGAGLLAQGSKGLAKAASVRRLGSSHIVEASLHLAADEGDTVARQLLKQLDDLDSGLLKKNALDIDDTSVLRHSVGDDAAAHLEGTEYVARIDKALGDLQRPGGGAAAITDEASLKAVFARSRRNIKNIDRSTGFRARNPITGTGYGPQLISQEAWSKFTQPIRSARGQVAEGKYFRLAADKFGNTFRTSMTRAITMLASDPNTPKDFTRLAYQAQSKYVDMDIQQGSIIKDLRSELDTLSDWLGEGAKNRNAFFEALNAPTLDAESASAGVDILQRFKTVGKSEASKGLGLDSAVVKYHNVLNAMREMTNSVRPENRQLGFIGENYVPLHWAEQAKDVAAYFRSKKIGKDSPRKIYPEWLNQRLSTIDKEIERGVIRWDEEAQKIVGVLDPETKVRREFDFTAYYKEIDSISASRFGPNFESVIVRDPIKVAISYLDHHRQELRYWTAMRTMTDHGLGYWADTVGGATTLEDTLQHIVKLTNQIDNTGTEAAKFAEESDELDSLMKQAVNAAHTGQILEWLITKKTAGAVGVAWDDITNVEMMLHKAVKGLVDDLHSNAFRTRQKALELREGLDDRAKVYVQRLGRGQTKQSLERMRKSLRQIADGLEDTANDTDELARKLADPDEAADGLARQHNKILKAQKRVARLTDGEIERIRKAEGRAAVQAEKAIEEARIVAAVDHEAMTAKITAKQDELGDAYVSNLVQRAQDWEEVRGPALLGAIEGATTDPNLGRRLQDLYEAEKDFARMVRDVPDQQLRSEFGLMELEELDQVATQTADSIRTKIAALYDVSPSAHRAVIEQGLTKLRSGALAEAARRKHTVRLLNETHGLMREAAQNRTANIQRVFQVEPERVPWQVLAPQMQEWYVGNQMELLTSARNMGNIWSQRAPALAGEDAERVARYLEKLNNMNKSRPTAVIGGNQVDPAHATDVMGDLGTKPQEWADYLEDYRTMLDELEPDQLRLMLGDAADQELERLDNWITSAIDNLWRFQETLDNLDASTERAALHINNTLGSSGTTSAEDYASSGSALQSMVGSGTIQAATAEATVTADLLAEAARGAGKSGSFVLAADGQGFEAAVTVALPGSALRHSDDLGVVQSWLGEITPLLESQAVVIRSGRAPDGSLLLQPSVVVQAASNAMEAPVALLRAQQLADGWRTGVDGAVESMTMLRSMVPENPNEFLTALKKKLGAGEKLTEQDRQVIETIQRRTIAFNEDLPPAFTTNTLESSLDIGTSMGRLADDLQRQLEEIAMAGTIHTTEEVDRLGRELGEIGRGVGQRIDAGDILRRDVTMDGPRVTRPDPYITAKSAGLETRPVGAQRGSLAQGTGEDVEGLMVAEMFDAGVREMDLPKAAQKILNQHMNKAFRSKKGITPIPEEDAEGIRVGEKVLRKWAKDNGLTEKLKPFKQETLANRDARIKGDAAQAHQKALDEEAAMSQHARRRLHDEYLTAWETEKASENFLTPAQLDFQASELNKLRTQMTETVDAERHALMNFLRADHNHRIYSNQANRLTKKAEDERKAILAEALTAPGLDDEFIESIAKDGVDSSYVQSLLANNDPLRLKNYNTLRDVAAEEAARVETVAKARSEARATLESMDLQFSDALPNESLIELATAGTPIHRKLIEQKQGLVSEMVKSDRTIRDRIASIGEIIDDMAARKQSIETIERLRPRALKASLSDYDRKALENAFVVFNKTKWTTRQFEAVKAAPPKPADRLNDKVIATLKPEEQAMIEKHFDALVGNDVTALRQAEKANTEQVLDTKAAGASIGIEPSRLYMASETTRAEINNLAKQALGLKHADRNVQGAVRKLAQLVEQAHELIVKDFKAQGLLDEAAEMSQELQGTISRLTREIVDDASELALVKQYRDQLESAAQVSSYHKADALAEGRAARKSAQDATHRLNKAWAATQVDQRSRKLVNNVVAALDPDGESYKVWKALDSEQQVRQVSPMLRILTEKKDLTERIETTRHFLNRSDELFAGAEEPERLLTQMTDALADLERLADSRTDYEKIVRAYGPTADGDRAAAVITVNRLADQDYAWTRVEEAMKHHPVNVAMATDDASEAVADLKSRLKIAEDTEGLQQSLINDYGFQLGQMHKSGFIGPKQLVEALETLAKGWNPGKFTKWLDQVTTAWRGVAIFSPGFVVRNFQGGLWNNFMSGWVSPKDMGRFTKGYFEFAKTGHTSDVEVLNVIRYMQSKGSLFSQGQVGMDVQSVALKDQTWNPVKPFGTKTAQWVPVSKVSELSAKTEDILRGSMAFSVFTKSSGSLEARYATAMAEIHKWHFDYTDLSQFDHNMRLVFPFWTWMSRNFQLQLRLMTERPQQALAADRMMENIGEGSPFNPYVPDWMNMARYVQLNQSTMINIELPPTAAWRDAWLGNFTGGRDPAPIIGATNPLPRTLIEMVSRKDLFRGYDLEGNDYWVRMAENVFPLYSRIHRMVVQPLSGDEAARQRWIWSVMGFSGVPVRAITDKDAQAVAQFEFPYRKQRLIEATSSPTEIRLSEAEKMLRSQRSEESAQQVRDRFLQMAREGYRG